VLPFLTPAALDEGEWSASPLVHLTPVERVPGTHCIRGWVGPIPGLDAMEKRKSLAPAGNRILPVAIPTELSRLGSVGNKCNRPRCGTLEYI
jgi:hypothetical protein